MAKRFMKYNPSFLSEEDLVGNFAVRHADLDLIIRIIRENVTDSNQHVLIIGPRGSGKTTLVLRAAAEIQRTRELFERWYPLIFSEESYEVVSAGEFWLEALFHLSEQTGDEKWRRTYDELKDETDHQRLGDRALSQLLDFADSQDKRILLIVENLNMLFGNLTSDEEAWKIRHTLMNEPRLMLLATATSRFETIENSSQAMFEMFKMQELKPLDDDECNRIWELITGQKLIGERIRPIQILTGGNPRLLTIIATFSAQRSFRQLLDDLVDLIDDHTEYFKSQLDNLPVIERKVYLALAELWNASTARDVARAARLDVNKTSSLLGRLVGRGAVIVEAQDKKTKWYMVAERMYNIYYLMRRRGKPADRVKAAVKFMVSMYDPESAVKLITEEACRLSPEHCQDHYLAFVETINEIPDDKLREKIIISAPKNFLESPYLAKARQTVKMQGEKTGITVNLYSKEPSGSEEKIAAYDETIERLGDGKDSEIRKQVAQAMVRKGTALGKLNRYEDAIAALDKMIKHFGNDKASDIRKQVAWAIGIKGAALIILNRYENAIAAFDQMIKHFGNDKEPNSLEQVARAMGIKGAALGQLNRSEEAIAVFDEMIKRFGNDKASDIRKQMAWAMYSKGSALIKLNRSEEAIAAFDEMIKHFGNDKEPDIREQVVMAMVRKGVALGKLNRSEEAIAAFDEMIKYFGNDKEPDIREQVAMAMFSKGVALGKLNRSEEAVATFDEMIKYFGNDKGFDIRKQMAWAMFSKGAALIKLNRSEEAIAALDKMIKHFGNDKDLDIREQVAMAMGIKGVTIIELNRSEEAIAAFDEMIKHFGNDKEPDIRKQVARAMFRKGSALGRLNRSEEAIAVYDEMIKRFGDDKEETTRKLVERVMEKKLKVLLNIPERRKDVLQTAEEMIGKNPENASLLNSISWLFYQNRDLLSLTEAEKWARRAVSLSPDDANKHHTLACILSALGKGDEALTSAAKYIQDTACVEKTIEDAIELFVSLAVSGQAKQALELLHNSQAQKHLEPLVVGLKMYLGEEVKTAIEIREVAMDVVKRIEERSKK